jgi:putative transposase
MGRTARIVVPGWPHHVTQRGNRRQTVFFRDRDRSVYLQMLARYLCLYHLTLPGYCLMTNHAHDALIPEYGDSLAKGVGRTHNDFSRWQNIQCRQTGHLWQERFYSCPVDFDSFAEVLAYIELNPVRAGLVKRPEDYPWSSARAHLSGVDETGLLDMTWWREHFTPESWARFLREKLEDDRLLHRIRRATATGKPLATESSIRELEHRFGRRLSLRGQW